MIRHSQMQATTFMSFKRIEARSECTRVILPRHASSLEGSRVVVKIGSSEQLGVVTSVDATAIEVTWDDHSVTAEKANDFILVTQPNVKVSKRRSHGELIWGEAKMFGDGEIEFFFSRRHGLLWARKRAESGKGFIKIKPGSWEWAGVYTLLSKALSSSLKPDNDSTLNGLHERHADNKVSTQIHRGVNPDQPHQYVAKGPHHRRTCSICGLGANAAIHCGDDVKIGAGGDLSEVETVYDQLTGQDDEQHVTPETSRPSDEATEQLDDLMSGHIPNPSTDYSEGDEEGPQIDEGGGSSLEDIIDDLASDNRTVGSDLNHMSEEEFDEQLARRAVQALAESKDENWDDDIS